MTTCREGCGACCTAVVLGISQAEVRIGRIHPNERDRRWILDELVPIKAAEAYEVAPWLRDIELPHHPHDGYSPLRFFYRCTNYDPDERTCRVHEDRPDVCRLFPDGAPEWPNRAVQLPPECEFNRDLGREPEPVPVRIRPSQEEPAFTTLSS